MYFWYGTPYGGGWWIFPVIGMLLGILFFFIIGRRFRHGPYFCAFRRDSMAEERGRNKDVGTKTEQKK